MSCIIQIEVACLQGLRSHTIRHQAIIVVLQRDAPKSITYTRFIGTSDRTRPGRFRSPRRPDFGSSRVISMHSAPEGIENNGIYFRFFDMPLGMPLDPYHKSICSWH